MAKIFDRLKTRRGDEEEEKQIAEEEIRRRENLQGEEQAEGSEEEPFGKTEELQPMKKVTEEIIKEATATLNKYKNGKANLENRVISDEQFWKMRHWEEIRRQKPKSDLEDEQTPRPRPSSAWLVSTIVSKHADVMDNFPEPIVLPREASDEESAKTLTEILPVVLKKNQFKKVYSQNAYEKLKHGTAVYIVGWNPMKENGIGDVDIKAVDLLNIFWEPGIEDIQDSQNLFITHLVNNESLRMQYPQLEHESLGDAVTIAQYKYDESIDTSEKTVVVDWYYKVLTDDNKTILHYVKFTGNTVLYASEDDPKYAQTGWYEHGQYPVVFDVLFPEKGTPCGFGFVSVCRDPQLYIDMLDANILESSLINTRKRWFASDSLNINKEQLKDLNEQIIDVAGAIDNTRLQEFTQSPLSGLYADIRQMKIDEMKETSNNRDVTTGGGTGGVTAAAGIAALQEAGNKTSRDMIAASYTAHEDIIALVIETIRQFYDVKRAFRVLLPNGQTDYVRFSNEQIKNQFNGIDALGNNMFRQPVFDLEIKSQKKNPFSRVEENERAISLYQLGFFNPERADEALMALDMMDFEGIEKIKEKVAQNQQLLQLVQQYAQIVQQLTGMGTDGGMNAANGAGGNAPQNVGRGAAGKDGLSNAMMEAQTPMTPYGQALAQRSKPDMESVSASSKTQPAH